MISRSRHTLSFGRHRLDLGARTCIMGVVNVTPDSFSDGGEFFSTDAAVSHGVRLAQQGADIVDVGGESTRPFSDGVSVAEEIDRVIPVIEQIAARVDTPISIDTTKSPVARRALEAGASIINDVSALRFDPRLATLSVEFDAPLILMHMLGEPGTMQAEPRYDDVVAEIISFLADAVGRAEAAGVPRGRIIVDPGIGFGKTIGHNLSLIKHLARFEELELPVLIGTSRKAFIRRTLCEHPDQEYPPQSPEVAIGTQATVAAAVYNGAHIVRVHDVAATAATVRLIDAVLSAE